MSRVLLLRHGATPGNKLGRYVGRTDERLSAEGRAQAARVAPVAADTVYASPLKRCLETAAILYPRARPVVVPDFRECDFGEFENLSYRELNGRADYQAWIDSGGTLPFPGGESRGAFCARCLAAFDRLDLERDAAIVAHGGTLMAILSGRALPKRGYFDWQYPCAGGCLCEWDGRFLHYLTAISP